MSKIYWPAFYLLDKRGKLHYRFLAKTRRGKSQAARAIEAAFRELLAVPA